MPVKLMEAYNLLASVAERRNGKIRGKRTGEGITFAGFVERRWGRSDRYLEMQWRKLQSQRKMLSFYSAIR
jgi:hypothetical protein